MIDTISEARSTYDGIENESPFVGGASIGAMITITINRQTSINLTNSSVSNTFMKYVNINSNGNINNGNIIISDLPEIWLAHVLRTMFNELP